ncbi:DUF5133 domain-containing protein [Streptomyces kanasensis]|uniref:DUF5133 domain-containing protein n=1 Tax=Streptomyces kanasensis TaxID=936756 RepID=UPI00370096F6
MLVRSRGRRAALAIDEGLPVLTPAPQYLRTLLARYADLRIAQSRGEKGLQHRLDDVVYTLCVATGTACVDDALAAADAMLASQALGADRPVLATEGAELAA